MKEAYWILDAGFQMWFLSTTFLNFSFHHSSSSDRCDTNWFFYFAFVSLTTSPSPHLSSPLLTFSLFSISTLIFCVFHWLFCLLSFMRRQKLIILYCLSAISLSLSSPTSVFVSPLTQLFIFLPLVNLFFFFTKWRRKGRVQIELQDR